MQFEFYVLNYEHNKNKVVNFNIFNNIIVQERTEKAIRKYLRSPKKFTYVPYNKDEKIIYGFEALVKVIDIIIRCEEWGRREYEISCGDAFETDCSKLEKLDCYQQAKPNMEIITREVLWQYKQQLKIDEASRQTLEEIKNE
jgi:hypothetical protein